MNNETRRANGSLLPTKPSQAIGPAAKRRHTAALHLAHALRLAAGCQVATTDDVAERIVSEVLAPADLLLRSVLSAGWKTDTQALARELSVDPALVRRRLAALGLARPTNAKVADPREQAPAPGSIEAIVSQACNARVAPIPIEDLVAVAGIRIEKREMPSTLNGIFFQYDLHGETVSFIVLSRHAKHTRQRFTMAHEFVHAAHTMVGARPDLVAADFNRTAHGFPDRVDATERLCDRIAAEVLMPADVLAGSVLQAGAGRVNSYALAREFDVSLTAMRTRLAGLGLLGMRPRPCAVVRYR